MYSPRKWTTIGLCSTVGHFMIIGRLIPREWLFVDCGEGDDELVKLHCMLIVGEGKAFVRLYWDMWKLSETTHGKKSGNTRCGDHVVHVESGEHCAITIGPTLAYGLAHDPHHACCPYYETCLRFLFTSKEAYKSEQDFQHQYICLSDRYSIASCTFDSFTI